MAIAVKHGSENDHRHLEEVARQTQELRDRNAAMLMTGFWGGIVVAMAASAGLVATYFLNH